MKYKDSSIGFSFELPDGWRHDQHNMMPTFMGANGRLIEMQIGTILPQYHNPGDREQFMAEPGANVTRSQLGNENNVVVLSKSSHVEITAVHDGVQYSIAHSNDPETKKAVDRLKESFMFPSKQEAIEAIQRSSNPQSQAIVRALKAGSPEVARRELSGAGMPPGIERPGYTMHRMESNAPRSPKRKSSVAKKWWGFWR